MTKSIERMKKNASYNTPQISPIWKEWLQSSDLDNLMRHPLLQALVSHQTSQATLHNLLLQHSHYSRHFTRYLCALMRHLAEPSDVVALMENLCEEMGVDGCGQITHAEMFQRTLGVLNINPTTQAPLPETQNMVKVMMSHCQSTDSLEGLAALCLGAEAIVPLIYTPILQALKLHGYKEDATEFFQLHIEEDEGHALTMLKIMQRLTQNQPERIQMAMKVGQTLINARIKMFDGIWHYSQQLEQQIPA